MVVPGEKKPMIKIAGYLEKRGKMRVVCRWKRWWFVLEGRLLLYYKSQLEYINLSPCRGSLNLGLASSVLPGKGLELQVITRSQTVTLRAGNRIDHDQWLQSLLDAMALQGSINPFCLRPVLHFRYCDDVPFDHRGGVVDRIKHIGGRSYTLATPTENWSKAEKKLDEETSTLISDQKTSNIVQCNSKKCVLRRHMSFSNERVKENKQFDRKSIRHSIRHSKIAFSDTSIPVSVRNQLSPSGSSEKCQSLKELQDSFCTSNMENHDYVEIDVNPQKEPLILVEGESNNESITGSEIKFHNSNKVRLNLDLKTCSKTDLKDEDIEIVKIFLDGFPNRETDNHKLCKQNLKPNLGVVEYNDKNKLCVHLYQKKEVKSDTDLSMKNKSRTQSGSCGEIHRLNNSVNVKLTESANSPQLLSNDKHLPGDSHEDVHVKQNSSSKTRSNSMIRKRKDSKTDPETKTESNLQRRGTLRKRSLSFLRRVWKKREKKTEEQDYETIDYESIPAYIEVQKAPGHQDNTTEEAPKDECLQPAPEPPPDYDMSLSDESEKPPMLPPRLKKRPHSPWHDIPTNNMPVLPPVGQPPPALPEKTRNKNSKRMSDDGSVYCVKHQELSYNHETVCYQSETTVKVNNIKKIDLDNLLAELSEVNISPITNEESPQTYTSMSLDKDFEPDYDIPRPHTSLLTTLRIHTTRQDSIPATNFFCSTPIPEKDSLDSLLSRYSSEVDITPDSLECEIPWSLSGQAEVTDISWPRPALLSDNNSLQRHFITTEDKVFEDSLNP